MICVNMSGIILNISAQKNEYSVNIITNDFNQKIKSIRDKSISGYENLNEKEFRELCP